MESRPTHLRSIGEVMSNFEHIVISGAEEALRDKEVFGVYPAMDFFATVWYDNDNDKFKCEIMQYHSHINTIEEDTLKEIMDTASNLYGAA